MKWKSNRSRDPLNRNLIPQIQGTEISKMGLILCVGGRQPYFWDLEMSHDWIISLVSYKSSKWFALLLECPHMQLVRWRSLFLHPSETSWAGMTVLTQFFATNLVFFLDEICQRVVKAHFVDTFQTATTLSGWLTNLEVLGAETRCGIFMAHQSLQGW